MDENNTEKDVVTPTADEGKTSEPSQEPEEKRPERTEKEKAMFTLKKNAERLAELGGDPAEVLEKLVPRGFAVDDTLPDDKPLTLKDLREIQKQDARKTAEQMADELDEATREKVKAELRFIVPSGDAEADFKRALATANVEHNQKIVEMLAARTEPRKTAAGSSAPPKVEEEFVPTDDEKVMMRPPYNLSKEKILEARKRTEKK